VFDDFVYDFFQKKWLKIMKKDAVKCCILRMTWAALLTAGTVIQEMCREGEEISRRPSSIVRDPGRVGYHDGESELSRPHQGPDFIKVLQY